MFLLAFSVPWRKHEVFTLSEGPKYSPRGPSPGRPGAPCSGSCPPSSGYSNRLGQRRGEQLPASWGAARRKGARCHLQLRASVSLVGTEITPSPGRAGRGAGRRRESQASRGRDSGFLPARQHPGDTGAPSGRYPACVDSCAPSRVVPRRSLRRSADTGFWAVPVLGAPPLGGLIMERDRAPPTPGTQAALPKHSEPNVLERRRL